MKTYHWNGEYWYERNWTLFHHIRNWIIWMGGWEKANGDGWEIIHKDVRGRLRIASPTPIALFGHRLIFYGRWLDIRIGKRILVLSRRRIYLSLDGTPNRADSWWLGAPCEIVMQVERRVKRISRNSSNWIGFDDGYDGEYANPYDKEMLPGAWLAYKTGFEMGTARFMADESTPLNEQLALAEENLADETEA